MEIEELKKKKNKDFEDLKRIKVELHKMQVLFKRYKELENSQTGYVTGGLKIQLPFNFDDIEELAGQLSTEELLIETAKVKNALS